jgi:hypothetical protein
MCKRQRYTPETQLASEGAYEGQTMRLDLHETEWGTRRPAGAGQSFHWSALWLIWPLIALVKWGTPLALGAFAAVAGALGELGTPMLALLLIAAGITLLCRS